MTDEQTDQPAARGLIRKFHLQKFFKHKTSREDLVIMDHNAGVTVRGPSGSG